jgi:hypothetical protein
MPVIGGHRIAHGLLTTMLALGYAILVIFLAAQLSIIGGARPSRCPSRPLSSPRSCGQRGTGSKGP